MVVTDSFFSAKLGEKVRNAKENGAHVDNSVMRGSLKSIFPARRVLACLLFIWALLVVPQVGWSVTEANQESTATIQDSQPPMSQPAPVTESRDDKKGGMMVSVQSLEDVMKVLTSSVPNRLEANVQPVTTAEAEKHGFRFNQGVVIIWLDPKGPLGRAGLATSDIILQVDNQPIEGLESFIRMVDALGTLQAATFSVLDHRTGRVRNVSIVLGVEHRVQEAEGGFLTRHVGAAVAEIQKTAQFLQQQVGYAADKGKEAVTTAIRGLQKWVGMTEKGPVASVKKGEEAPAKPPRPAQREAAGGPPG
jgi:membrane-associated protease RseP (regulator of RpoE activity)